MSYGAAQYASTADQLVDRIVALIPEHPEILDMTDPWSLLKVEDFKCGDLGPSFFQASWALVRAKKVYRAARSTTEPES